MEYVVSLGDIMIRKSSLSSLLFSMFMLLLVVAFSARTVYAQAHVCDFAGPDKQSVCNSCMGSGTGTWTAFGCISTDPSQFVGQILRIGIGLGGGIAFLLILFGGFQILTSAGNPNN